MSLKIALLRKSTALLPQSSVREPKFRFPWINALPGDIFNLIGTDFLDPVSLVALAFTSKKFNQIIDPLLSKSKFCEKAAELGYLKLVQWGIDQNCRWASRASVAVAKWGCLPILKWAWKQGCLGLEETAIGAAEGNQVKVLEWLWEKGVVLNADHADAAACHGHIKLFQDLKSKLGDKYVKSCGEAIHPKIMVVLIKSGNLTALKALLDEADTNKLKKEGQGYLNIAAEVGNLESLKFLLNLNIVDPDSNSMLQLAAKHGQIKILDYILFELHKRDAFTGKIAEIAAQNEQWGVLRWLITQDIIGNEEASVFAAEHNRMEELELMHSAKWPMSNRVCTCAAAHGHWELVKHLIGKDLACEECLLYFCAAKQGKIDLLNEIKNGKWKVANSPVGFWNLLSTSYGIYDDNTYRKYALAIGTAWSGNVETLQWVEDQGFEWRHELVAIAAVHGGNLEVLQWLFQRNCPYESKPLYLAAAHCKHFHIIGWLIELSMEVNDEDVGFEVAKSGQVDLFKKLVEKGCPVNSDVMGVAAHEGHWDIVKWLDERKLRWSIVVFEAAAAQGKEQILSSYLCQHLNEVKNLTRTFNHRLVYILAQHNQWKIFNETVVACVNEGIPNVLQIVKARGYSFDVEAVIKAAYARRDKGDNKALEWLQANNYLPHC